MGLFQALAAHNAFIRACLNETLAHQKRCVQEEGFMLLGGFVLAIGCQSWRVLLGKTEP